MDVILLFTGRRIQVHKEDNCNSCKWYNSLRKRISVGSVICHIWGHSLQCVYHDLLSFLELPLESANACQHGTCLCDHFTLMKGNTQFSKRPTQNWHPVEFENLENDASQGHLQGKFNNISTTDLESIQDNGEVLKQNQQKQNLCLHLSFNSTLNKLILLACMEPIILSKY